MVSTAQRHLTPMLCGNRIVACIYQALSIFKNDASDNFSGVIFISFFQLNLIRLRVKRKNKTSRKIARKG